MTNTRHPTSRWALLPVIMFAWFISALTASAQNSATGTITGRILNPATGEYVRNVEISIPGTSLTTVSGDGGVYQIDHVPAGDVNLKIFYTGYDTINTNVKVNPGETATRDFELKSSMTKGDDGTVTLAAFTVSSEREGNAKAIMQQRNSMDVGNVVSSDIFGDVAQGNVGEFLKYLPGVDLDYVEADARTPRLHGLPPQYVGVTLDGNRMASADAGIQYNGTDNVGAGVGARSFSFEQVSLNSVESIEVNFSPGADVDADSPAGNINLKTKRAFDRKGRQVSIQAIVGANSEDMTLAKSYGPDDKRNYKVRPSGIFEYSDVFLNKRLGVILNISESNAYDQQRLTSYTFNNTPTAADPRPSVLSGVSFKSGPKFTERSSVTFTVDYKVTPRLAVGFNVVGNYYANSINNRTFGVTVTNPRVTTAGTAVGDGLTSFSGPVTVSTGTTMLRKRTSGIILTPTFDYKWKSIRVDGLARYSRSTNTYAGALANGTARDLSAGNPTGVTATGQRSDTNTMDWTIVQTGGQDWGSLSNYRAGATAYPRVSDDGRYARKENYLGSINAQLNTGWSLPTLFKVGAKTSQEYNQTENRQPYNTYEWRGGGQGSSYAAFPSLTVFDMGHGVNLPSLSGLTPAFASRNAVADYFNSHRSEFVAVGSPANYESAYYTNHRAVKDTTNALYVQGQSRLLKRLEVRAGVRWEQYNLKVSQFVPLLNSQVFAAGFPTVGNSPTGNPNSPEGMDYKYRTLGIRPKYSSYDRYFPSVSLKYSITPNLQAQFGYSTAIGRPSFNDVGGVFTFNETNFTATVPNPNVGPETSKSYNAKLAYYFEPVGNIAVSAFEIDTRNALVDVKVPFSALPPSLIEDPTLEGFLFTTKANAAGMTATRGVSFEYAQQLSFLPKPLNGLGVASSYTRTYVTNSLAPIWKPGVSPNMVTGGLNYSYSRLRLSVNGKWTDVTPYSSTVGRYRRQRTMVDMTAAFIITKNITFAVSGRNIFDVPDFIYNDINKTGSTLNIDKIEYYGASWTAAVKVRF